MQRRILTAHDVQALMAAGTTEWEVDQGDVITDEARELARKLGLKFRQIQKTPPSISARSSNGPFESLFQPIFVRTLRVENRLALSPMVTSYAAPDGSVTERLMEYYSARAKGGVGLIIVEATFVYASGRGFTNQLGIHKDGLVPGLKELVDRVHSYGSKIAIQLHHAGRQTFEERTGMPLMAPSAIACPVCKGLPAEMTKSDIKRIVEAYRESARRAREAGFDAVEIHGGHGYLVNQFFSKFSNARDDEYGGSFENRARFSLEVLEQVRRAVGDDFPITYRISSEEFVPNGVAIEESKALAILLADNGIDLLHVSGGVYASAHMFIQPAAIPLGLYVENANSIKQAVAGRVPVMVVGRINNPELADEVITGGRADMIAMGRGLLADPDFPRKVREGDIRELRKCIACNRCGDQVFSDQPIRCLGNPLVGMEWKYDLEQKADSIKRVLVVGGGPGGLEASWVAALRGHEVYLYEREHELGGLLKVDAVPPHKGEISNLLDFLVSQVEKLGVTVNLGEEVTAHVIDSVQPDEVILATGSKAFMPPIPGIDGKNVLTPEEVLTGAKFGQNVVIIGGGSVGCETAEFLAGRGAQVTIVEMLNDVAADLGLLVRNMLLERLKQGKIEIWTGCTVLDIRSDSVIFETNGRLEELKNPDTVVIAAGMRPVTAVGKLLADRGIHYHKIGDCIRPRSILDAIHDGFRKAYEV